MVSITDASLCNQRPVKAYASCCARGSINVEVSETGHIPAGQVMTLKASHWSPFRVSPVSRVWVNVKRNSTLVEADSRLCMVSKLSGVRNAYSHGCPFESKGRALQLFAF